MTLKNKRTPLLCHFKLCASSHSHMWVQNGVTVRKRSSWVKIGDFLFRVTLKVDGWPWKTIEHIFYATSSFVHHFIANCQFKMELESGNAKSGSKSAIFVLCDLDIWPVILKNNRALLLRYFKLCASFYSHLWIQNGVTVRKRPIWVKIGDLLCCVTMKLDGWPWKNKRALLLCNFKLCASFNYNWIQTGFSGSLQFGSNSIFIVVWPRNLTDDHEKHRAPLLSHMKLCASFHCHMWIQIGVTFRKRLHWFLTSVNLTFDLDLLPGYHFCRW